MDYVIDLVDWYTEILREDPSSEVFISLAEALYKDEKWDRVAAICRRGLQFHPSHLRARALLGFALVELGHSEDGVRELEKARCDLEKNAEVYRYLASALMAEGDGERGRRFSEIYKNMQAGEFEPVHFRQPAEQDEQTVGAHEFSDYRREPVCEDEIEVELGADTGAHSSQLESLLSRWLGKSDEKAPTVAAHGGIFAEKERQMLSRLLAGKKVQVRKPAS
jgi:tetratricopeptide (TPR) repeat protein